MSILKGNSSLPPEDRLLKFLVDNNADAEETVQCANCDQESNKKVEIDNSKMSILEMGSSCALFIHSKSLKPYHRGNFFNDTYIASQILPPIALISI